MPRPHTLRSLGWGATVVLVCIFCARPAYGDVGVVLNETLDESVARVTGSGHTAVYFSRICPESPVKLRLCGPGEYGSVMSNYINLGEDERFEWNIAPFSVYVYGVEDVTRRPIFGSPKVKKLLEENYREQVLATYCAGQSCITSGKAEWREMVAAGMSRSMYIFVVETTLQQDLDLIAKFNAMPNENHFNSVTRNCADFTKDVVDTYFPHSAHRDVINDFGMTSPKAVARSFSHYAQNHPESHFRVLHFSQLPGTIKRSTEPHSGTEQLYHSKKLLIPMVIFADHELPVVAAAYLLTGRFNPQREFERHTAVEQVQLGIPASASQPSIPKAAERNSGPPGMDAVETQDREQILGAPAEWENYRQQYETIVDDAVRDELIPGRKYVSKIFKRLDESGAPTLDSEGDLWLEFDEGAAGSSKVGLSMNNIFAPDSDPRLAFELLLARVGFLLKSPKHSRETMLEFKDDWALLEYARERISGMRSASNAFTFHGSIPSPLRGD
jgi:hypothetical protein